MADRKKRVQLNTKEKEGMIKKIKLNGSDEGLLSLADSWNAEHPCRPIDITHLKRLKAIIPEISEAAQFWETIKSQVEAELISPDALSRYEPRVDGSDYNGHKTKVLDANKIPFISKTELETLCFDFELEKYNRPSADGLFTSSTKKLNSEFRDHFQSRGIAYAPFSSFINRDEKQRLNDTVGPSDLWAPSDQKGIWKTVGDAVLDKDFKRNILQTGNATFSDVGKTDDRINPNYSVLKNYFAKRAISAVTDALASVLVVCESLYRSVEGLVPTESRKDSRRRQYAVMPELNPGWFSLLTCVSKKTKVQREHMDDHAIGAAALWGLVEEQYVIVWLYSYEMNLEIERIAAFYDFIMTQKPPNHWSDEAFWNLFSTIHLQNQGFASGRRPRPVKIPLKVRIPLLFIFITFYLLIPILCDT